MDDKNCKRNTKTSLTGDESNKTVNNHLSQQQPSKRQQPAQERLKRLQTNLKTVSNKKPDKERSVALKSSSSSSNTSNKSNVPSLTATTAVSKSPTVKKFSETPKLSRPHLKPIKYVCPDEKPKQTVQPAQLATSTNKNNAVRPSNISKRLNNDCGVKNAWAKPKALLDASNRLDNNRAPSANQRLALLRESLQLEQQNQTNDNNNNNNYNMQTTLPTQKLQAVVTKPKKTKQKHSPVKCVQSTDNNGDEPMDIDLPELERVVEQKIAETNSTTPTAVNLDVNKNIASKPKQDEDSDMILSRHLKAIPDTYWPDRLFDHMYFVLDTNVLIDNLTFVEDLCHVNVGGSYGTMLYIPYIVIKELDNLKNRRSYDTVKDKRAMRAIRFLNDQFDNNLKIQAQSALEETRHLVEVDCPDDSIINCCMQIKKQVPCVTLLTNDNNLRLKAKASGIRVSSRSELLHDYFDEFDELDRQRD